MSILTTKAFWVATLERAVKTGAQSLLAVGLVGATGVLDVDWAGAGSAAGLAASVSVLTSIASAGVGSNGPSLGGETIEEPPPSNGWGDGI